jgi:hypothetical protein
MKAQTNLFKVGDKFMVRHNRGKNIWITRTVGAVWTDKAGNQMISEENGYNPILSKNAKKPE